MADELDFSRMRYKVHELKEGQDPFLVFTDLQKYPEFHENLPLPRKKVLKYVIFYYDIGSPLRGSDVFRLKIKAAELAGFKRKDNRFEEMVEKMILCELPQVNDIIVRFITGMFDVKYQKMIVLQQVYFKISQELISGENNNIKNLTDTERELQKTQEEILNRDTSEQLLARLQRYYLEEKVELRPEDIASRLLNNPNELPI